MLKSRAKNKSKLVSQFDRSLRLRVIITIVITTVIIVSVFDRFFGYRGKSGKRGTREKR